MTYMRPLEPLGSREKLQNGTLGRTPPIYFREHWALLDKRKLRTKLRAQRDALSIGTQQLCAKKAAQRMISQPIFKRSQKIGFYWPYGKEMDPQFILQAAKKQGKQCYLPVIQPYRDRTLAFVEYFEQESLIKNTYGILQPRLQFRKPILNWTLDLVLVPLLAFDKKGNRLGQGKGFYDQSFSFILKKNKPKMPRLIGLAYEFQSVDTLPVEAWDVPLSGILTEERLIFFE